MMQPEDAGAEARAPRIASVNIVHERDLLGTSLDLPRLRGEHPELLPQIEDESFGPSELREAIGDSWRDYLLNDACLDVVFDDGSLARIRSSEIINWHGTAYDGHAVWWDNDFIYVVIYKASGQAGSLGIWNVRRRAWAFTRSDELFCVEALLHIPSARSFVGWASYWYPMVGSHGDFFFTCGEDGSYDESQPDEIDVENVEPLDDWTEMDFLMLSGSLAFNARAGLLRLRNGDQTKFYVRGATVSPS